MNMAQHCHGAVYYRRLHIDDTLEDKRDKFCKRHASRHIIALA